jgi:acetylornithine deacetylase/succinyl-diaminopimelate desuccinylase-like protein
MDQNNIFTFINAFWDKQILPALTDYIKIPNKSPQFDPHWKSHGYMDQAVQLISDWCKENSVSGMTLEVVQLEGRTPLIYIDIPGKGNADTILLYGHLDKQPEMAGWDQGLSPWNPVLRGDRLYGRGAADDGYAAFASLAAIKALQTQNIPHHRCVIIIEACEESGSTDLPFYVEHLSDRIGKPSLVICLDSGCGNYEQLWVTTSLRGLLGGTLSIEVLKQGIHSGMGSGVVPSCFRILRQLLNRIENEKTGNIELNDLYVDIPSARAEQASKAASILGHDLFEDLPFVNTHVEPEAKDADELILRRTWKPALSLTGIDDVPSIENAGNVTLPKIAVKLSMRLPPTKNALEAGKKLKEVLEKEPPSHAKVHFEIEDYGSGWNAPAEQPWLKDAANSASQLFFGRDAVYMGEGGSIPFMGMLGEKFPEAQFLITGVLGPESNAHGPNEFLHIPTGKKLTACVAEIIARHFKRSDR